MNESIVFENQTDGREAYAAKMRRLAELIAMPGWQDVVQYLDMQARSAIQNAPHFDAPHKMGVAVGAHNAFQDVRNWPAREIKAIQQHLTTDSSTD